MRLIHILLFALVAGAGVAGFLAAFRAQKSYAALACLLLMSLGLKLVSGDHPYLSPWDERFHALVAKNAIADPFHPTLVQPAFLALDPSDWSRVSVWLHKPPLTTWVLAASMRLFGVNVYALRLPSLLISTAAIALTFWIGQTLYNPRVGLLAAWFHTVTGVLIAQAAGRFPTDHVDTLFFFLTELGIALALAHSRKPSWTAALAIGVVFGLALLTKWLPALLIFAVWVMFLNPEHFRRATWWRTGLHFAAALALGAAMFLTWRSWTTRQWPVIAHWEETYNARHFFEVLEGHAGPWYFHLLNLAIYLSPIVYIPLLGFTVMLFRKPRPAAGHALALWILLPYTFYSLAATKMAAFVFPAAPAIFLVSALFWWRVHRWSASGQWNPLKSISLFLLFAAPAAMMFYDVLPEQQRHERDRYTAEIQRLPQRLGPQPAILFNAPEYIEVMFFTSYSAIDRLPTPDDIAHAHAAGYRVVLLTDDTPATTQTAQRSAATTPLGIDQILPMPPAPTN